MSDIREKMAENGGFVTEEKKMGILFYNGICQKGI